MRLVHSKTMSESLGGKDGGITRDRERVIVRETGSENERREERHRVQNDNRTDRENFDKEWGNVRKRPGRKKNMGGERHSESEILGETAQEIKREKMERRERLGETEILEKKVAGRYRERETRKKRLKVRNGKRLEERETEREA